MLQGYDDFQLIGEGGLGRVYRARRVSTGGTVAVKELRDVQEASPAWHRARRELEALLRLKGHPYVINVEEIAQGPNGPCLVMELAPHGSLLDRLETHPFSPGEIVLIGQQVCDALSAAHSLGIVHRDIKPHNLLIGPFGQVKVCDFGISQLAREGEARTKTGALTMAYASPEELDGDVEIGPAADVYSFGATMMHLVTGRRPSFKNRMDTTTLDLSGLDSRLAAVMRLLRSSMAHDPEDRPTVDELTVAFDEAAVELKGDKARSLVFTPGQVAPTPERAPSTTDSSATLDAAPPAAATVIRQTSDIERPATPPAVRPPAPPTATPTLAPAARPNPTTVQPTIIRTPSTAAESPPTSSAALPPERRRRGALIAAGLGVAATLAIGAVVLTSGDDAPDNQASVTSTADPAPATTTAPTTSAAPDTTNPTPASTKTLETTSTTAPTTPAASSTPPISSFDYWVVTGQSGVVFTPDSSSFLAVDWLRDAVIGIDAATGTESVILRSTDIRAAVYSPDGTRMATVETGAVHVAKVFDVATGALIATTDDIGPGDTVVFSPDGSMIMTSAGLPSPMVWDATTGAFLSMQQNPNMESTFTTGFAADSTTVATLVDRENAGEVTVWNARNGSILAAFGVGNATKIALSPDANWLLALDYSSARLYNARTGAMVRQVGGGSAGLVHDVQFSPDGSLFALADNDDSAKIWSVADNTLIAEVSFDDEVYSARFTPDGSRLVATSIYGVVKVINLVDLSEHTIQDENGKVVYSSTISPDNRFVVLNTAEDSLLYSLP